MKKFLTMCAFAAVAFAFTGCGVASTSVANHNLTQTQVVLSENNFRVVGQAHGEVSQTYVLGIGGLSRKALRNNAINEMAKNAELTGAQTLTNTTVSYSVKMITPFFVKYTCCATANIVEFTK